MLTTAPKSLQERKIIDQCRSLGFMFRYFRSSNCILFSDLFLRFRMEQVLLFMLSKNIFIRVLKTETNSQAIWRPLLREDTWISSFYYFLFSCIYFLSLQVWIICWIAGNWTYMKLEGSVFENCITFFDGVCERIHLFVILLWFEWTIVFWYSYCCDWFR